MHGPGRRPTRNRVFRFRILGCPSWLLPTWLGRFCGHLRVTEKIRAMADMIIDTLSGSIRAGLSFACPRCGRGKLFQGFLTPRPRSQASGLDYICPDAGNGPALFIMFIAGFIVVGAALIVEALYHPP